MAVTTLRERGPLRFELGDRVPTHGRRVIVRAILLNLLNPKLSIFFFAFMPQFVRADDPNRLVHMLASSAVFVAATFVVFVGYGTAAAAVRHYLLARERALAWLRRVFAAAFVALAARLAFSDR
jgi:threonine/homoserine/homoserine lactone efflux protein